MQVNYPVGYSLVTHSNGSGYGDSYSYSDGNGTGDGSLDGYVGSGFINGYGYRIDIIDSGSGNGFDRHCNYGTGAGYGRGNATVSSKNKRP